MELAERFGVVTVDLAFRLGHFKTRPEVLLALRSLADKGSLHTRAATVSDQGHVFTYFTPAACRYDVKELAKRVSLAALAGQGGPRLSGLLPRDRVAAVLGRLGSPEAVAKTSEMPFVVERGEHPGASRLFLVSTRTNRDLKELRIEIDRWLSLPDLALWRRVVQEGLGGLMLLVEGASAATVNELRLWFDRAPLLLRQRGGGWRVPVHVGRGDPLRGGVPKKTKDP